MIAREMAASLLLAAAFLLPLTAADSSASAAAPLNLLHVSLVDLQAAELEVLEAVRAAVTEVGMFAVTGATPAGSQEGALGAYTQCIQGAAPPEAHTVELADATRRTTLATGTNATRPLSYSPEVAASCPAFVDAAASLRAGVDAAASAYAAALDGLAGPGGAAFASQVAEGESLEHFHLFTRPGPVPADRAAAKALHLHSDMGLFIVMTPASYVELTTGNAAPGADGVQRGFFLELPDGTLVEPVVHPGSLLVMNGEGLHAWVDSPLGAGLAVPRHEVDFELAEGAGRAWFGRMVLPSRGAALQHGPDAGLTFNQYRSQTVAAFQAGMPEKAMSTGCHPAPGSMRAAQRHLLQHDDADSCAAGEMHCWMQCMEMPDCGMGKMPECKNTVTGAPWVEGMCPNCALVCPSDDSTMTGGSGGSTMDVGLNADEHAGHDHVDGEHDYPTPTPTATPESGAGRLAPFVMAAAALAAAAVLA